MNYEFFDSLIFCIFATSIYLFYFSLHLTFSDLWFMFNSVSFSIFICHFLNKILCLMAKYVLLRESSILLKFYLMTRMSKLLVGTWKVNLYFINNNKKIPITNYFKIFKEKVVPGIRNCTIGRYIFFTSRRKRETLISFPSSLSTCWYEKSCLIEKISNSKLKFLTVI